MGSTKRAEYEEMGGQIKLEEISKVFYDKIYQDPWLKQYFVDVPQEHIERQQVMFMQAALGGENLYCGQTPPAAHKHMYITNELYQARKVLLDEAFVECNAGSKLIEKWLRIDDAFFNRIVKVSPQDCHLRYKSDKILNFVRPHH